MAQQLRFSPIDLLTVLESIRFSPQHVRTVAGITSRQLTYWTDHGFIPGHDGTGKRQAYTFRELLLICLVAQGVQAHRRPSDAAEMARAYLENHTIREMLLLPESAQMANRPTAPSAPQTATSDLPHTDKLALHVVSTVEQISAQLANLQKTAQHYRRTGTLPERGGGHAARA